METEGGEQEILLQGEPINIRYGQVDDVLVDGESVVENHIARIALKTVDDLVNYYTKTETFTKQEVNDLISAITTMDIRVVQTLPTEDISTTTIYLVPKTTAEQNDAYDEYIYVSNAWEHIGSTDIDLSGYQTKIDSSHKLSSDLVDDTNQTNKFVTSADISNWNSKQDKKTKTITQLDARWHSRWIDCGNGNALNLDVGGDGRLSMTPMWITSGTVLNVNVEFYTAAKAASTRDAYVDIEFYNPGSSSANARGWVRKIRTTMQSAGNITLDETGYYVISTYNCVATKEPLWDYGYPYTFSYEVDEDFEVNYVNTVDWGTKDIVFVTNGRTQKTFSNGLNWACRREPGQPYYLSISGVASEYDRGCYQYTTNDFSGTRSSTSRQAIFVYGDEIWYFAPSIDGHVGISSISKFKIYDNNWIEYVGHCWHNLGHMNSVGYDKETDTFIWGNGSSSYVLEGEGYILNNFSTSKLATSYRDEIVLMTDMDINTGSFPIATYGFKLNVIPYKASCNNNKAPYNLYVAMVTNDGNTVRFGKIVADSSGKYLWANCTWENPTNIGDITETQTQSYEHCTQGMTILNGHVIMGEGHTKPQIATIWNNTVETMRTVCWLSQFSDSGVTCVATYKGKLIYCSSYEWIFTDITSLNNGISEDKIDEIIDEQVDLTNYVENTDYANTNTAGVIKTSSTYGTSMTNTGVLYGDTITYANYPNTNAGAFISKGTFENVITGKGINPTITLTQAQYDDLATKDPNVYYYIIEE